MRPALARSETALVSVVAKGYEAYRERLAVLLRDAPSVAGERIVAVKLTPEDG